MIVLKGCLSCYLNLKNKNLSKKKGLKNEYHKKCFFAYL